MKTFLISILLSVSFISSAQSYVNPNIYVRVSPGQVTANVTNPYGRTIVCQGNVQGRTRYGNFLQNYMYSVIHPYSTAYQYVWTNYNDPFVHGWANIHCNWW